MWLSLFATVSLVGQGIQAGALFMFMSGVVPTFRTFPVPAWLEMHRSMDSSIERFMPKITVVTILAGVACEVFDQSVEARVLRAIGIAGSLAVVAISEGVNVPINRVIKARLASPDGYSEAEMSAARTRWITWHRYRTYASVIGLDAFTVALAHAGTRI